MDAARTLKLDEFDLRYAKLRLEVPELGEAMRASIERHGLLQPLVANATSDGAWVLLDGNYADTGGSWAGARRRCAWLSSRMPRRGQRS